MADLVLASDHHLQTSDGTEYRIQVWGEPRPDGTWVGWLEFVPAAGEPRLRTDRETTQPSREALAYWATGLEPVYFEGAFARAHP